MGQLSIGLSYLRAFDYLALISMENIISFAEHLVGCAELKNNACWESWRGSGLELKV